MSYRQNSQRYTGTDSFSCREPGKGCESCSQRQWRQAFSRFGVLVVLAAFALLSLLACLDDSDSPSITDQLRKNAEAFEYSIGKIGETLTLATVSEPSTLNPALAKDAASSDVLGYLFEGLTEVSWLTDQVEPALAESWTRSQDGLVWVFSLRNDVVWHDGTPFTAHDVEFTFNRIIYNDEIDSADQEEFNFRFLDEDTGTWAEEPMTVTALNDYTVLCVLPVPFATFLRSMETNIYPKHILESHVEAGTFATVWNIDTDPAEVIGTGPFTIERYVPKQRVVLRRNPNYWLRDGEGSRLPYLERVVHIIVPDFDTELARFKAGDADIHTVKGGEFAELESLQTQGNFKIHRRGPGFGSTFLTFNMNPGRNPDTMAPYVAGEKLAWFQNVEFRRAVVHSVDKDRIIRDVQHGLGYP
ncbi:MAG: ABC transporter substrate-binding protein, partial [Candidatus Dadabacteria bacterium]|nr:ABC transporter substrate-binding protein [Candidatus Dadabacteria bacterium]